MDDGPRVVPLDASLSPLAVQLLHRFFAEEGFSADGDGIAANLDALRRDPHHWAALALDACAQPIGIVTVTTMLYVEWGRLAEIGDLYVLPTHRRLGAARAMVAAARRWCRSIGCSAISVTVTPDGQAAHGLSRFYAALGFVATGRTLSVLRLDRDDAGPGP